MVLATLLMLMTRDTPLTFARRRRRLLTLLTGVPKLPKIPFTRPELRLPRSNGLNSTFQMGA